MTTPPVPLVPREVLFGNPERVQPRISPDGRRLAWIAPVDGVLNVWVGEVGAGEDTFRPVTSDTDRGIRSFSWAHDNRRLLYVQDKGGDENWRLYDVDLDSGATRDLTPFDEVQAQVVAEEKTRPSELLVALNKDNPQLHDVYHLDLATGTLEKMVENFGVVGWVADGDLVVRAALRPLPDGSTEILARSDGEAEWESVLAVSSEDALNTGPIGFDGGGTGLYLLSSVGANASRLIRLDLSSGASEVLAEDPRYDVGGLLLHPDTRVVQMVSFIRERTDHVVLDPDIAADVEAIATIQPGDWTLVGRDHADATWLVGFTVDNGPVAYWAWDRTRRRSPPARGRPSPGRPRGRRHR